MANPPPITPATPTSIEFLGNGIALDNFPLGALVQGVMVSPEIDWLSLNTGVAMAPVLPGKFFVTVGIRVVATQANGSITTGPTWNMGNNVAKTNVLTSANNQMLATAMSLAATNGVPNFTASLAPTGAVAAGANTGVLIVTDNPFLIDVTVATVPNTATIWKGKVYLAGFWVTP